MGADIHNFICGHKSDGSWKVIETYGKSEYPEHVYDYEKDEFTDEVMCDQFYEGRNYTLFGLLAEVRADGDDYFTEVRGLPEDTPELLLKYYGGKSSGFHSATWYNLVEIRSFLRYLEGVANLAMEEIDMRLKYDPEYSLEDARSDREYSWQKEQYESMRTFYEDAIRFLYAAGEERVESHLEDYRVYCWFDS